MTGADAETTIGFALLGAGAGAEPHAEALASLPGVRLVVVADPEVARAKVLAGRFGGLAVDRAEAALDKDDVQAACIVVPNYLHAPLALAAARRGIPVLVEKPLAASVSEARKIVHAFASRGLCLGLVLQNRFAPATVALREDLRAGRLGHLVSAMILVGAHRTEAYFQAGPWRARMETAGGGALMVQAVHMLDLLDWLAGPVVAATASAATRKHPVEVEDVLCATLELAGGIPATLMATTAATPEFPARLELFGTEGTAVLMEARGTVRIWRGDLRPSALSELVRMQAEMVPLLAEPWPAGTSADLHRKLLADFAESVRTGRPPAVDPVAALHLQEVVDALYTAVHLGQRVPVGIPPSGEQA
jgi:predicted dehydrogenase